MERDLVHLSERLTGWEYLYGHLGITESERNEVKGYDYGQQKLMILKLWKRRRGFQATFKALFDVFSEQLKDQTMVGIIYELAEEAMRGNWSHY